MTSSLLPQSSRIDNWMALDIGRYLQDTAQLNTTQSGAYLHLLMYYWAHGPLSNDPEQLAAIAKMSPDTWSTTYETLKYFFSIGEDGLLHQKGADRRREFWILKHQKAKEKALKAINTRWARYRERKAEIERKKGENIDTPSTTHVIPENYPTPVVQVQKNPSPTPPAAQEGRDSGSRRRIGSLRQAGKSPRQLGTSPRQVKRNKGETAQNGAVTRSAVLSEGKGHGAAADASSTAQKFVATQNKKGVRPSNQENGFDPRHERFKAEVFSFWRELNPAGLECPWDGGDRALAAMLSDAPSMKLDEFKRLLHNRADSEISYAALPRGWLRKLKEYSAGALDRFGKPLKGGRRL